MEALLIVAFVLSSVGFALLGFVAWGLQVTKSPLRWYLWVVIILGATSLAIRFTILFL